jgi:glucose-6-phosphate isomerase, archaeal
MQLREPVICPVSVSDGRLGNASGRYTKCLSDLAGLYADEAAFSDAVKRGDDIVYDVTDFRPSSQSGDMIFGVTRMSPGRIGDEFFLTRGHIHARADRPEIYYGETGQGVMLLESPEGEIRALPIGSRDVCYVPPFWIHRSVNVGAIDLVMTFAYPADAGQDYAIIERSSGMRARVVTDGDSWKLVDNTSYRPRSAAEVAALFTGPRPLGTRS